MYKDNIKFFALIIIIFLLTSCDDYHCIEANDTGEYETEVLTLSSTGSLCTWDQEDGTFGSASSEVSKIAGSDKYTLTIDSCTIGNVTCQILQNCIQNKPGNISGCITDNKGTLQGCDSTLEATYLSFYHDCMNKAVESCETKHADALDTQWISNGILADDNTEVFKLNGSVIVQASNSITLTNAEEKRGIFTVKDNTLQVIPNGTTAPLTLSYPIKFSLSGSWCKGGEKATCNGYENQMGSTNNVTSNTKHTVINNFLRRGVIVLKDLPDGGSLDENNNYIGPMLQPVFDNWNCDKPNVSSADINAIEENFYSCYTGYSDTEFLEKNNELYPIETTFQKDVGGFVVPNNVLKYITPAVPYVGVSCITNNNKRICSKGDTQLKTWTEMEDDFDSNGNAGPNDTNEEVMYNTVLLDSTGLDKNFLYPNKVAFKIIGNTNNGNMSGACNINIQVSGANNAVYQMTVEADNRWHFLTDNNNNFITINKDDYNTIMPTTLKNQNFSSGNFYNVKIETYGTWTDEDGNEVPCGEGMGAFFMPQNEILINKSGFVSFKNLFAPVSSCDNILYSSSNYACVDNVNELYFTIINPMYNINNVIGLNTNNILRENFYEYIKDNNYNSPIVNTVGVSLSNNNWSSKIFVRKGQIIRFNEKSWYNITPLTGGGYDIKSKIMPLGSDIYKSVSHGLVLKIEERPALFCDGFEMEEVSFYNQDNEIESGTYSLIQCYDLENYVGSYRKLREENGIDNTATIKENGKLNNNDILLGARKLANIFDSDNKYGNFNTMYYKPTDNTDEYESTFTLPVEHDSIVSFLVLDNSDFSFTHNSSDNDGSYTIDFSPMKYFANGEQISVALAYSDWDGNNNTTEPISWLVKYNTDSTSTDYGQLDPSSAYEFDSNGRLVKKGTDNYRIVLNSTNFPGLSSASMEKVRLFFKIVDLYETCTTNGGEGEKGVLIDEILCKCSDENDNMYRSCTAVACDESVSIEQKKFTRCSSDLTANNSGDYKIQLNIDNGVESGWMESGLSSLLMAPIFEIFDGKNMELLVDNNNMLVPCDSTAEKSGDCYTFYNYEEGGNHARDVGTECIQGQYDCYKSCKNLSLDQYYKSCRVFNSGTGFVERFYNNIIQDETYNRLITVSFALMFSFYGLYFLLGLADFNQEELIKKLIKISFIYLMISNIGWDIYRNTFVSFFKDGMDYISYSIANSFSNNANIANAIEKGFYGDKSILFADMNSAIYFIFNDKTQARIGSIFFSSFIGCVLWALIWFSILLFLLSLITAMVLYTVSQVFVSFFLGFGPVFFVCLIFDRTKGMFDKWFSNLIGFSFEQIFLLTCAYLFNNIILSILKGIFSYKVCYEPIFRIEILSIKFNFIIFWKPANSNEIPGLSQILMIFLLAYLSKNFLKFMANLGSGIGGAEMSSSSVGSAMIDTTTAILKPLKNMAMKYGGKGLKMLGHGMGYHSREDVAKENEAAQKLIEEKRKTLKLSSTDVDASFDKEFGKGWEKDPEKVEKRNQLVKEDFRRRMMENPDAIKDLKSTNMTIDDLYEADDYKLLKSASMSGLLYYYNKYGKNSTKKYMKEVEQDSAFTGNLGDSAKSSQDEAEIREIFESAFSSSSSDDQEEEKKTKKEDSSAKEGSKIEDVD